MAIKATDRYGPLGYGSIIFALSHNHREFSAIDMNKSLEKSVGIPIEEKTINFYICENN